MQRREMLLIAAAFVAGFLAGALFGGGSKGSKPVDVREAINKQMAEVTVHGIDFTQMHVTVRSTASFTLVLPAGTIFTSKDSGTQNMMVAQRVIVVLHGTPDAPDVQDIDLPAYCINHDLDGPGLDSAYSVDSGGWSETVEKNPVQKLAECLEGKDVDHQDKQHAIWLISDEFIDMTPAQYVDHEIQHFHDLAFRKGADGFAEFLATLFPTTPKDFLEQVKQMSDSDLEDQFQQIAPGLKQEALQEIDDYKAKAGPLLDACGYSTSGHAFFQS